MIRLEDVVLVASDDPVKTDLEITCTVCGERLADAEHGDTMQVLHDLAVEHLTTHDDPGLDAVREMPDPVDDLLDLLADIAQSPDYRDAEARIAAMSDALRQAGRLR